MQERHRWHTLRLNFDLICMALALGVFYIVKVSTGVSFAMLWKNEWLLPEVCCRWEPLHMG